MEIVVFKEFIGQKIKSFEMSEFKEELIFEPRYFKEELIFELENGKRYKFFHEQDCCEDVYIEDISGDLNKLIGKEILKFEERTQVGKRETWTFYDIETIDCHVQIRWHGESNGYYSESVDFIELEGVNE